MKNITSDQIKVVLEKHAKYLQKEEGGERADLRDL